MTRPLFVDDMDRLELLDLRHFFFHYFGSFSLNSFCIFFSFHDDIAIDPAEKQRFLSSVISKLEASEHAESNAIAHAFALRAQVSLETGDLSNAIIDAKKSISLNDVATQATISLAYRVWADAEQNDPRKVIAILQQWRKEQPAFQTKLQNEIKKLLEEMEEG